MDDIETNIRRFLQEKAARSQQTFMPFKVEREPVLVRPSGTLLDCR